MSDKRDEEYWLTVSDIEKQYKIPNATVRRYINQHGHHLKIKKRSKSYLIELGSVETIRKIREWYSSGKGSDEVEEKLVKSGIPMTITVEDESGERSNEAVASILQEMKETMDKRFDQLETKLEEKDQTIRDLKAYIDSRLEQRDQLLIQSLRSSLEDHEQIAVTAEKEDAHNSITHDHEQRKPWWKFW